MRKISLLCMVSFIVNYSFGNNLQFGALTHPDANHVQFTIQWDNSWKVTGGPANYDAVWVFLKYQDCSTTLWQHLGLSTASGDHTITGGVLQIDAVTDGKGVFIHRAAAGSGNISSATVTLRMSISDATNLYNYQLSGIEMVYIPQGDFYIGDGNRGGGSTWGFSDGALIAPKLINNAIQSAGMTSAQYQSSSFGSSTALPATYPMGYNAFYVMKYEVSQKAYATFLNTLTYDQQATRFSNSPLSAPGTFAIAGLSNPQNCRNGIRIKTSGHPSDIPAVVGCDLNLNSVFDEADDGQYLPCNWLSWADLMAFLDWAAIRPMTEFEYEKVCRGANQTPIANEYVWGSNIILTTNSGSIANPGTASEVSVTSGAGLCANNVAVTNNRGPLRCGFAATATSNRPASGSTYYGVMEMAGNVMEQCIGGYNGYNYSPFTNASGDGALNATGNSDSPNWPALGGGNAGGGIARGGNWLDGNVQCQTSNRDWMTSNVNQNKDNRVGGRGVRTP